MIEPMLNLKRIPVSKLALIALLTVGATACGGKSVRPNPSGSAPPASTDGIGLESSDSSLNITYVLGHNQHRFFAEAKPEAVLGQTYLDRQLLRESPIDRGQYVDLLKRTETFVNDPARSLAQQSPCRNPFSIAVRVGKLVKTANGCRSSDKGALARLLRDGEFLLYSKK